MGNAYSRRGLSVVSLVAKGNSPTGADNRKHAKGQKGIPVVSNAQKRKQKDKTPELSSFL